MSEETKQDIAEQLSLDIKIGFENEQELFDSIRDMFDDDESLDEDWLRQTVHEMYRQHQQESRTWTKPTDFEKLANAFDELIREKIVCLHYAGQTKQDGEYDCMETIEALSKLGIQALGYCYYHGQDLGRAVNPEVRNLLLGFDSPTQDDDEALQVAGKIVEKLKNYGFEVAWPGTVKQRIEIKNIDWKKTPDDQDWGPNRVIALLTAEKGNKKPFWKFW